MHRAKYSATCQTSRPGRRRWPSRARSWSRRGCTPDRGLFVAEERGSHELKGVPEPVTLFRLVRASGGGRRSGQRHLTPLVGRDVAAQRQRSETISVRAVAVRGTPRFWVRMISRAPRDEGGPG
jgi:hypothetical protein